MKAVFRPSLDKEEILLNEKDSFSQVTVRIMDVDLEERIRRAYLIRKGAFDSKSKFLIYLATLGVEQIEMRIPKKGGNGGANDALADDDLLVLLNGISEYLKDQVKRIRTEMVALEGLAASTQESILQLCEGTRVDREAVEKGFYDKLPKRFRIYFCRPEGMNCA